MATSASRTSRCALGEAGDRSTQLAGGFEQAREFVAHQPGRLLAGLAGRLEVAERIGRSRARAEPAEEVAKHGEAAVVPVVAGQAASARGSRRSTRRSSPRRTRSWCVPSSRESRSGRRARRGRRRAHSRCGWRCANGASNRLSPPRAKRCSCAVRAARRRARRGNLPRTAKAGSIVAALARVVKDIAQGRQCGTVGHVPAKGVVAIAGTPLRIGFWTHHSSLSQRSMCETALRVGAKSASRAEARSPPTQKCRQQPGG